MDPNDVIEKNTTFKFKYMWEDDARVNISLCKEIIM